MTPLRAKLVGRRIIRIERVSRDKLNSDRIHYVAGGTYLGIVINKAVNGIEHYCSCVRVVDA